MAGQESVALPHHDLEDLIDAEGRELLRLLFQAHLDLRKQRERERAGRLGREVVWGADGMVRPHREPGHSRRLACVFRTVTVTRTAWWGRSMTSVHPLDADLWLSAGLHSHGLRQLAVTEAVRGSYDQAKEAIDRRRGKVLGIVMRPEALRPATLKAHRDKKQAMRTRLAPGEKANRKRMATLACVFDADPAVSRPYDIIAPPQGRGGDRPPRPGPKAAAKWLCGSVIHPAEHTVAVFEQAEARGRDHARNWLAL